MSDRVGDDLRHVRRIPLLTPSEELHLAALVQRWRSSADPAAVTMRLVVALSRQQLQRIRQLKTDPMDEVQAGNLGLIRAVKRFQPEGGYRFSAMAAGGSARQ